MNYCALVQNILGCSVLREAVEQMNRKTLALNLIDTDWETALNESPVHQKHKSRSVKYSKGRKCVEDQAEVRHVISPKEVYNVVVAGTFIGNEDDSFSVRQCEPLTEIGKAMAENSVQKLHDGARLYVQECNPTLCHTCVKSHERFKVPFSRINWCVLRTRVFNGETISNAFKCHLTPMLVKKGFMAIIHAQIFSRTTFGDDMYKLGGRIKDLIVFQESALESHEAINFGYVESQRAPSIEYPPEKQDDAAEDVIEATPSDHEPPTKKLKGK